MILSFHPCFETDAQIILGDRGLGAGDLETIQQAEAILLPQSCPEALYRACSASAARLFPCYDMRFKYPGKIGQNRLFKDFSCPHPHTLTWPTAKELKRAHPNLETFPQKPPFLIKEDRSHEGAGVYLVADDSSWAAALEDLARKERSGQGGFVTQDFIPAHGNALRVVIMGKQIESYWKRTHRPDAQIATLRGGATIDHEWRPELQEKGKDAARALSGKAGVNLAAVDFVFPLARKDPDPLFLEINYYFGRRGLGGTAAYYRRLYHVVQEWLIDSGLNPESVRLV